MDKQDRYDELVEFLDTLKYLKEELKSKDLIEELEYLIYGSNYMNEKDELEKLLNDEWENETKEREREYRKAQGF